MIDFLLEPISQMAKLEHLNLSRNVLTSLGTIGMLQAILTRCDNTGEPSRLRLLNLTGSLLRDDGVELLLPLVANRFNALRNLNMTACRLTEASRASLEPFLAQEFPVGRRLIIDLKL